MPITRPLEALLPLPRQIQIEPVGECNLRCAMCLIRFREPRKTPASPAFMEMTLFKDLVDQFPNEGELHLQGLGEPLLHPRFFEMVSYAVRHGMRVTTNSNMTRLDRERAEECVRSKLSWIRISIDGSTPDTYESIRTGSRLERVLGNIELLRQAKKKFRAAAPRLFLVMVIMRRNIHELKEVVRLAHDRGLEQVFVQHLCYDLSEGPIRGRHRSMQDFIEAESLLNADRNDIQSHFNDALATAGELRIELRLPHLGVRPHAVPGVGRTRCDWPWRSAYISSDGRAMPCCMIGIPERLTLGNMARDGVLPVWNSGAYREFRSRLASDDPPSLCRTCSVYRGTF